MHHNTVFKGTAYTIVEGEGAEVLLLEGRPIAATCAEHGSHQIGDLSCPRVWRLLEDLTYDL
ncbi:hypothetical protein HS1genome_0673 [Sulfodiicoccus acidiphilus]|uniref:SWIM-type domain-containing protein n=1 Tax=Sulfodiicoccus acidiphilus TaxID=1670455 RepID=A0A348B282_9CREN|nr:hypothetical protein [Sulfodiicoccus acidiphilus]BBD72284.1 hypothetical protein HS1genome_0673 [Sulfodiicoccus acidiphilus]GGT90547.1 hypothetical protein GCM10007116_05470 [Sulfodiicoccus acidiphilus]